ncbi:hypothetical protein O7599_23735 [Streptomyces sp. WMMC500]|uniref:hypothetical protein n=1 Tax=Streptomyces sp. WMMC500 TaxID=3015154 RepID=UPI00248C805E|nr:hypothetical protein [Streptomyces sp. WMMC500]WBB58625.1 hypothetical protein O7599_23735 [Streptomyces sp. WMMC500]
MKTRERTAAAGGRSAAPVPQSGDRLPFAPRERKPALAALAVLLILAGALGTAVLVLRAGNQVAAVQISQRIPAGQGISEEHIEQVMMPEDSDIPYIRWNQRGGLDEFYATTDLVPGSVLVSEMIQEGKGLEDGQTVVGVTMESGQMPGGLTDGARVDAYFVGDNATSTDETGTGSTGTVATGEVLAEGVKVQSIVEGDEGTVTSGTVTVNLLVDKTQAGPLVAAASEKEVGLTLVSSTS